VGLGWEEEQLAFSCHIPCNLSFKIKIGSVLLAPTLQHGASMAAGLHLGIFWPWISPTHLHFVPFQPGQVGFPVSHVETAFQEVSPTEGNCVCAPERLPGLEHAHSSPWYISYLSYLRRLVETSGSQKHVAEKPIYQKSNTWGNAYLQN
jgi:hypothetical protein